MIKILLLLSLFGLFYCLIDGKFPEIKTVKDFLVKIGLPLVSAGVFFVFFTILFMTPLSGAIMAVLGWCVPSWIRESQEQKRLKKNREHAKNLITSAGGLYGAGLVTSEVFRALANRFPEPFGSELQSMVARRELDPTASIPKMLNELADKYNLPEFKAEAAVIAASENAGGPIAAAKGSKRLGKALRLRDDLIQERIDKTYEPKIAASFVIAALGVGILLDATAWRNYFSDGGEMVLAFSVLLFVGITLMTRRSLRMDMKRMIKKIKEKCLEKAVGVKCIIDNERGSLDIFTTKLGLAVVTVLVIVALIAVTPGSFSEFFEWFTSTMKTRFRF